MTAPLPYAHLLKRRPTQQRSVGRVEGILDAAAAALRDQEPEVVTIRDLADRAGVPTGTLYQFFEDKDAVFQALAVRFVAAMPSVLEAAVGGPRRGRVPAGWAPLLERVVAGYADMVRAHPAIRRLWLSGSLDAATRQLESATDAAIGVQLGAALNSRAGTRRGTPAQWRTLVALVDGLLRHAFTIDPDGDRVVLREAKRAAIAYARTILE